MGSGGDERGSAYGIFLVARADKKSGQLPSSRVEEKLEKNLGSVFEWNVEREREREQVRSPRVGFWYLLVKRASCG
jgi:hypothetical protein